MKKTSLLTMGAVLAFTFNHAGAQNKHATPHWSYSGKTDPAHWAELESGNSACKLSKEQSPINIVEMSAR